jgi:hypothetical protein
MFFANIAKHETNLQKSPNLGFENPWLMPIYESP